MRKSRKIAATLVLIAFLSIPLVACSSESGASEPEIAGGADAGTSELTCLYREDFSDTEKSWGWIEGDPEVQAGLSDGVYRITGTWFGQIGLNQQGGKGKAPKFPNDLILEADVQFVGEAERAPLGPWWQNQIQFEFRVPTRQREDGDYYYLFCISSDGYTWIDKYISVSEGDGTLTTSRTKIMEPQRIGTLKLDDFNHFRLEAVGNALSVYVNDEAAFTLDEAFQPLTLQSWMGIVATASCIDETGWGWSQVPYEILVDNVCVYLP